MNDAQQRPEYIHRAPDDQRFKGRRRVKPVDMVVIHESVTKTAASAVRVLQKRRLSVHYTIERGGGGREDGRIVEHCEPELACAHAGVLNKRSIAIEVINPYYPKYARAGDEVIDARFAHKGRLILPSVAQCESTWRLIRWLTTAYEVPLQFPGLTDGGRFRWGRVKGIEPGVVAHHRTAHADGLTVEAFCVLRYGGLNTERAYDTMRRLAASGKRVTDLPVGLYCEDWPKEASADELECSA